MQRKAGNGSCAKYCKIGARGNFYRVSQRFKFIVQAKTPYLQRTVIFILTLAIIGTTIVSWFNLNSFLIICWVVCRLMDGGRPLDVLRDAFSNRYFWAYFSLFAIEAAGLLYTDDGYTAYKHVESKATLVAIPFVLCSGKVIDRTGYRRLMQAYCWLLVAISFLCGVVAGFRLRETGHIGVFFYHALTEVIGINAVFFSVYVLFAILFLLSPEGRVEYRKALIAFLTVMMFLLDSKLLLALLAVIVVLHLSWGRKIRLTARSAGLAMLVVVGITALAVTPNPVRQRYRDILHDNWRYIGEHHLTPQSHFNGVSLRLLMWQFAGEIISEKEACAVGVSSGDSQDLLNRKYLSADMHRRYLGYNFHNQFIETFVRSGVTGLLISLAAIALLVQLARRTGTKEAWWALITLLLLALTESTLEMQHSLFPFCFFPLLFATRSLSSWPDSSLQPATHDSSPL